MCLAVQGPVSPRLMTSQFKDIVTDTQKCRTVKCILCGVWVQNFVWNFKGALWNFTQNIKTIQRKICISPGVKNLTTYDILRFSETSPRATFHKAMRRLIVRSREDLKPRDWVLTWSYSCEIWDAHRKQCCWGITPISERLNQPLIHISRIRDCARILVPNRHMV